MKVPLPEELKNRNDHQDSQQGPEDYLQMGVNTMNQAALANQEGEGEDQNHHQRTFRNIGQNGAQSESEGRVSAGHTPTQGGSLSEQCLQDDHRNNDQRQGDKSQMLGGMLQKEDKMRQERIEAFEQGEIGNHDSPERNDEDASGRNILGSLGQRVVPVGQEIHHKFERRIEKLSPDDQDDRKDEDEQIGSGKLQKEGNEKDDKCREEMKAKAFLGTSRQEDSFDSTIQPLEPALRGIHFAVRECDISGAW